MATPPRPRLSATPILVGLFGLLFAATACALLFLPGPASPLPGLGVAAMGVVGVLAFRSLMVRARDTELALEEGERYIEAVADLSQDIHAIIQARSRNFLYVNPAVANLLGYGEQHFLKGGLPFFASLVHKEDLPAVSTQFEQILGPPADAPPPQDREPIHELTFRARDKRGIYRRFKCRMTVFARQDNGRAAELLAVIREVPPVSEAAPPAGPPGLIAGRGPG